MKNPITPQATLLAIALSVGLVCTPLASVRAEEVATTTPRAIEMEKPLDAESSLEVQVADGETPIVEAENEPEVAQEEISTSTEQVVQPRDLEEELPPQDVALPATDPEPKDAIGSVEKEEIKKHPIFVRKKIGPVAIPSQDSFRNAVMTPEPPRPDSVPELNPPPRPEKLEERIEITATTSEPMATSTEEDMQLPEPEEELPKDTAPPATAPGADSGSPEEGATSSEDSALSEESVSPEVATTSPDELPPPEEEVLEEEDPATDVSISTTTAQEPADSGDPPPAAEDSPEEVPAKDKADDLEAAMPRTDGAVREESGEGESQGAV